MTHGFTIFVHQVFHYDTDNQEPFLYGGLIGDNPQEHRNYRAREAKRIFFALHLKMLWL